MGPTRHRNLFLVAAVLVLTPLALATNARAALGQYQQTATLTNALGASSDVEGHAVALSADGSTLVAGAPGVSDTGAVYVYTRGPNGWVNSAAPTELLPENNPYGAFGISVAVSEDGSVIVVGAPDPTGNGGPGAVYVYNRPQGGWPSNGVIDTTSSASFPGLAAFGWSVAVSPDGSYVAVGAPTYTDSASDQGMVIVYSYNGVILSGPPGAAPIFGAGGDQLGQSLAMPSDSLIYAGATGHGAEAGAIFGFSSESSDDGEVGYSPWDRVSQTVLTVSGSMSLGVSVAADGGIVVAGDPGSGPGEPDGAAYIFEPTFGCPVFAIGGCFSSSSPTSPVAKLTTSAGSGTLGQSVAVGSDGGVVLVGDPSEFKAGSAAAFLKPATGWAGTNTADATLIPIDTEAEDYFGSGVAISSDGSTLAVGGPEDDPSSSKGGEAAVWESQSQTTLGCQPAALAVDAQTTCTATVTDTGTGLLTPTGNVTFTSNPSAGISGASGCTLVVAAATGTSSCRVTLTGTAAGVGNDQVSAIYAGDDEHIGSTGMATVMVEQVATSTKLSCNPAPVVAGQPTICTATVSNGQAGVGTPAGTVAVTDAAPGTFSAPSCTLGGSGDSASCQVGYTPAAAATTAALLTATYAGDKVHASSRGSDQLDITAKNTTPSVQLTGGRIRLRLSCRRSQRACRITATLKTTSGTLAAGTIRIPGGKSKELTLVPRKAALRRLSPGSHRVSVSLLSRGQRGRPVRTRLKGECVIAAGPRLVRFTLKH